MVSFDPYAILHVRPEAGDEAIATAFRTLARANHPDLAGEGSTSAMAAINAAWELIGTPEARAAYDRDRRLRLRAILPQDPTPDEARAVATAPEFVPMADGTGAAGPPPGRVRGSILPFGRHLGWSLWEIAKADPGYLEWLEERRLGRPYAAEIDEVLRQIGRRDPALPRRPKSPRHGRWARV
jgi:curved DNA-binding protein CbpA